MADIFGALHPDFSTLMLPITSTLHRTLTNDPGNEGCGYPRINYTMTKAEMHGNVLSKAMALLTSAHEALSTPSP